MLVETDQINKIDEVSRNMAEMEIIKKTIAGLPLTEMLKKVEKVAQFSSKSSIE